MAQLLRREAEGDFIVLTIYTERAVALPKRGVTAVRRSRNMAFAQHAAWRCCRTQRGLDRRHLSVLPRVAGSTSQDRCHTAGEQATPAMTNIRRRQATSSLRVAQATSHQSLRLVMATTILRISRARTSPTQCFFALKLEILRLLYHNANQTRRIRRIRRIVYRT